MGILAKRKTKDRMRARTYNCSLDFETVRSMFEAVADETEPLRGVLSKGLRPYYCMQGDRPTVEFGGMWTCTLLAAEPGFR